MLGVPFLGEVPIDPQVVVGGDTGEPIVVLQPDSPAAHAFRALAAEVVRQVQSSEVGHKHEHHDYDHDHAHAH